jgi:hypothetical protein
VRKKYGGILVKYEEIERQLPEICAFIGINYQPGMKEFWKHPHHGLLGSKTAYSLVRAYHQMGDGHGQFVQTHGFSLKPRVGHGFLDKADIKVFAAHGGKKLNRLLGYG